MKGSRFHASFIELCMTYCIFCLCKLRLQDLANKARATATRLTASGVQHQEASIIFGMLQLDIQLWTYIPCLIHRSNLSTYTSCQDIQQVCKSSGPQSQRRPYYFLLPLQALCNSLQASHQKITKVHSESQSQSLYIDL